METNLPRRNAVRRMPVWCRRLLVGTVAFVLFMGGIHWYQRHQISVIYAKWRAEGLPTNREELANYYRPPVGGTDNSALWVPAVEKATNTILRVLESRRQNDKSALGDAPPFMMLSHMPPVPGQPWDRRADVESFLKQLAPEIQALYHAAEAGGQARYPVRNRGDTSTVDSLLYLESRTARYHRDTPRRIRAIRAMLALSNTREGSVEEFGWGTGGLDEVIDFLNEGPTDDQLLAELQKLVCQIDYLDVTRTCMAFQLISCIDYVQARARHPFATANELEMLRRLESLRPAYAKPWPDMMSEVSSFSDSIHAINKRHWEYSIRFDERNSTDVFDSLLDLQPVAAAMANNSAKQSSVNVMLAAVRHQLRHGSYPATISAIDSDLMGKGRDGSISWLDPFTSTSWSYHLTNADLRTSSNGVKREGGGDSFEGQIIQGYSVKRK